MSTTNVFKNIWSRCSFLISTVRTFFLTLLNWIWSRRSFLIPTIGTLCLTLSVWAWSGLWHQDWVLTSLKEGAKSRSEILLNSLSVSLNKRLSLLEEKAPRLLEYSPKQDVKIEVAKIAKKIGAASPGTQCFSYEPQAKRDYIYQLADEKIQKCRPFIKAKTPDYIKHLGLAMRLRSAILTGPYQTDSKKKYLVAILALFKEEFYQGLAAVTFDVSALLKEAEWITFRPSNMKVALRKVSGQMLDGEREIFQSDPVIHRLKIAGGDWEMAVIPKGGWAAEGRNQIIAFWVLTFFLGGFFVLSVFLLVNRRRQPAMTIEEGTQPESQRSDKRATRSKSSEDPPVDRKSLKVIEELSGRMDSMAKQLEHLLLLVEGQANQAPKAEVVESDTPEAEDDEENGTDDIAPDGELDEEKSPDPVDAPEPAQSAGPEVQKDEEPEASEESGIKDIATAEEADEEKSPEPVDAPVPVQSAGPEVQKNEEPEAKSNEGDPSASVSAVDRGKRLLAGGDLEGAKKEFGEAIALNEKSVTACIGLGETLQAMGDQEGAKEVFNRALEIDERPEDLHIYNRIGIAARHQKDYKLALSAYDRALFFDAEDPMLYYFKSMVYVCQMKYKETLDLLNKALEINSEFPEAQKAREAVIQYLKPSTG